MGGAGPGEEMRDYTGGMVAAQRGHRTRALLPGRDRRRQRPGLPGCSPPLSHRHRPEPPGQDVVCRSEREPRFPLCALCEPQWGTLQPGRAALLWPRWGRRRLAVLPADQPPHGEHPHLFGRQPGGEGRGHGVEREHCIRRRKPDPGISRPDQGEGQCIGRIPQETLPYQVQRRQEPPYHEGRHTGESCEGEEMDAYQQLRRQDTDAQHPGLRDEPPPADALYALLPARGRNHER